MHRVAGHGAVLLSYIERVATLLGVPSTQGGSLRFSIQLVGKRGPSHRLSQSGLAEVKQGVIICSYYVQFHLD